MSGLDRVARPHPKQRRRRRSRVASPALTMLLSRGEAVSGWVHRAIPSATSFSRSTQHKSNPVDVRSSDSCQPRDPDTIVPPTATKPQRQRCHRRSLRSLAMGVGGADLDAVEAKGEGSGVVIPLDSVAGKCNATMNDDVNGSSNLAGTPGTPVGVAGTPDSVDSWRGRRRSNNGPGQQQPRGRRVLHRTVGKTSPIDPVVRQIKSLGRSGMWQEALEELKKVERLTGSAPGLEAYEAAIFAMGCSTKWRKSLSLLDEMEARGIRPDERCYTEAIKSCGKSGKFDEMLLLLDKMAEKGVPPSLAVFKVVLESCLRSRKADRVTDVLAKMERCGIQPDDEAGQLAISAVVTKRGWSTIAAVWTALTKHRKSVPGLCSKDLNAVAHAFGGLGEWEMVLQILGDSSVERPKTLAPLDLQSYNLIVSAHASGGDGAGVLRTFEEMEASGHRPGVATYMYAFDNLAKGRGRYWAVALEVFDAIRSSPDHSSCTANTEHPDGSVVVTDDMWNSVITNVAVGRQLEKARSLLDEASSLGVELRSSTYDAIIFLMGKREEHEALLSLAESATNRGVELSSHSHTWKLVTLNKLGRPQDALDEANELFDKDAKLNVVAYNAAVYAAGELGLTARALEIFEEMKGKGLVPTQVSYSSALAACAKARSDVEEYGQKAAALLEEMHSVGIEPYPPAHHEAITAIAAAEGYEGALTVLARMKAKGIPLTSYSYSPVFKCAAKEGDWESCVRLLDSMAEAAKSDRRAAPDSMCFDLAISACAKAHKGETALQLLGRMKTAGLPPSLISYSTAMDACAKSGWWRESLKLMEELRSKGLEPNVMTYNSAIEACATAGEWASVMMLIDEMKSSNSITEPTVVTFSTVLKACSNWEMAEEVMTMMRSMGIKPNHYTYTALISVCGKTGDVQQALAQLEDARKQGLSPNRINYNCCVDVCAKSGKVDYALTLLEQMQASGDPDLAPDLVTFNSVINACAKAGDWALALWLLTEIKAAGLEADIQCFNAALDACTKGNYSEGAVALLGTMRAQGIAPDAISYQSAISACRRGGDSASALRLMQEMERDGFPPGEAEYNLVIETVGREGDWNRAVDLLKQMKEDGVEPDVFSYGAAIGACSKGRNPELARVLLEEMRGLGHQPNRFCWNGVVNVHARTGDLEGALALMEEMKKDMACDENTFLSVVHGCAQTRDWETAHRILAEMRDSGFKPSDACYYTLVSASSNAGELDVAEGLLPRMRDDGVPPDLYTYSALMLGCGRNGDWKRSARILGDMKSAGIEPTTQVYTSALRACAAAVAVDGVQVAAARNLLEEMKARDVPRDDVVCGAAMEVFGKAGNVDEALALIEEMRRNGLEPSLQCYSGAIAACASADDIDGGLSLLAEMGRATSFTPNAESFQQLISASERSGKAHIAQDLRRAMAKLGYA